MHIRLSFVIAEKLPSMLGISMLSHALFLELCGGIFPGLFSL
jgi:hypothetical protein